MAVDVQVTLGMHGQVEAAMVGEELEHVVEEADARLHLGPPRPVEVEGQFDLCLGSGPAYFCATWVHVTPHSVRSIAERACERSPSSSAMAATCSASAQAALRSSSTTLMRFWKSTTESP